MKRKLQFAGCMLAMGMSTALAVSSFAQGPRANSAQNRQQNKPPAPQRQQQRQAQRQPHQQQQQAAQRARNERQNGGGNRAPSANPNRPSTNVRPNNNPNRPPSAYTPPPARKFNELSPQERQKVVESYNKQKNLTPAQRQEITDRYKTWQNLTPEQRNHIKNDVVPKWRQLPPDRQRAISQRLGVLKNMPESARNQHLNDPNFTRGMSEEDKATLRDLSHMHVGGPPEPPSE
jgi:hypothetical protein